LRKTHPEKWVVIYKGEVVGSARTANDLRRVLRRLEREKGLSVNDVTVRYVTKEPHIPVMMKAIQNIAQAA